MCERGKETKDACLFYHVKNIQVTPFLRIYKLSAPQRRNEQDPHTSPRPLAATYRPGCVSSLFTSRIAKGSNNFLSGFLITSPGVIKEKNERASADSLQVEFPEEKIKTLLSDKLQAIWISRQ
ncbi:PREDICTED: uncharacterized protein LOC105453868 [Wasmannia auropunctata]|uniref:uncharacterized protein LOC105453868 n=1 Tax=Wasmannia auropunctata TaxID=64793 RepID=UPI0005EF42D4|nr:PREDICTED: uncharacterized protein LOC105453868 [Wasmannia auropunctata]